VASRVAIGIFPDVGRPIPLTPPDLEVSHGSGIHRRWARLHMIARITLVALSTALIGACSHDGTRTMGPAPIVVSVAPASGATGVDPATPVVVVFSQRMMRGMEANVVLHEESVTGPVVSGTATWSVDGTTLTFAPGAPLRAATTYVLHLAPTMMSGAGSQLDHGACTALGGRSITSGSMGAGMRGGGMAGGGMMGDGWGMTDGAYGMTFVFTTA
jgi:hypothetical protein